MFTFKHVTLRKQGDVILDDICLHIASGERVALLGASGAGKSTLLQLMREQQPNTIAWCPQDGAMVPPLSVFHNIYMGSLDRHHALYNLRNLIYPKAKERRAVNAIANALGLAEKLFTSIDKLSGGQAQRTALGRALYAQKATLLADEPVSSLDELQGGSLLRYALSAHSTSVIALHDQFLALSCFDRIIGLRNGKILIDQPAASLNHNDLLPLYGQQR
jgi:phosphonate transport system ATP-binding protein